MKRPIGAFAWPVRPARYFDEAVVEAKVVSQRVLPALGILPVVRKPVRNKLVDITQR